MACGIGAAATLAVVALCFPDLLRSGRIWAEEGALFLGHILQSRLSGETLSWLYLHNGHWDLWTNITALLAARNPQHAAQTFTFMALVPHAVACGAMVRYTNLRLARERSLRGLVSSFALGSAALLTSLFAGGPEVFVTTTNSQWMFCVYVVFIVAALQLQLRNPGAQARPGGFAAGKNGLDLLAALSSFAAVILLPIQLCVAAFEDQRSLEIKHLSSSILRQVATLTRQRPGLAIGFAIQVITTLLCAGPSLDGRSLMPLEALRGFLVQGLFGLWVPRGTLLNAFAAILNPPSDSNLHIKVLGWMILATVACALLIILRAALVSTWSQALSLFAVTLIFANLALGDKSELTNAGSGMRYFAPERIAITWLLLTQIAVSWLGDPIDARRVRSTLYAAAFSFLLAYTSLGYFAPTDQKSFGLIPGGCMTATHQALQRLGSSWSHADDSIPICPQGWTMPLR